MTQKVVITLLESPEDIKCFKVNVHYGQTTSRNKVAFFEVHKQVSGHFLERSFMCIVTLVTALAGCAERKFEWSMV